MTLSSKGLLRPLYFLAVIVVTVMATQFYYVSHHAHPMHTTGSN